MVINKDGLITDNQNEKLIENNDSKIHKTDTTDNFDLYSKNLRLDNISHENSDYFNVSENKFNNIDINFNNNRNNNIDNNNSNINVENSSACNKNDKLDSNLKNKELGNNSSDNSNNENVETNCLALTIRNDYNYAIAKNTVFKTIRMSIKVAISTFFLNLLKLFF